MLYWPKQVLCDPKHMLYGPKSMLSCFIHIGIRGMKSVLHGTSCKKAYVTWELSHEFILHVFTCNYITYLKINFLWGGNLLCNAINNSKNNFDLHVIVLTRIVTIIIIIIVILEVGPHSSNVTFFVTLNVLCMIFNFWPDDQLFLPKIQTTTDFFKCPVFWTLTFSGFRVFGRIINVLPEIPEKR